MLSIRYLCLFLTLCCAASAQLSGTYTVNPALPASAANYTSLAAATADILFQGLLGPVTMEIYDDAGPYTEANAFTAQASSWAPGTAVLVLAQWPGSSAANRVTFRAAPGESVLLDASGQAMGVFWNGAQHTTIEGLEIANAIFDGVSMYSDTTTGQPINARIRRCDIHDCGGTGVTLHGSSALPLDTSIENNFFWNLQTTNTGLFNLTSRFGYVSSRRALNTTLVNNSFLVTTGVGSDFCVIGSNPSGSDTPFAEVSNNIIVKSAVGSRPIFRWPDSLLGTSLLPLISDANCIFDTSGGDFAIYGPAGVTVAQDLPAWQGAVSLDLASISADPMFVDPGMGDLHLQPGSPCIDASLAPSGVLDDIDGELRGALPDIGADEAPAGIAGITVLGTGCVSSMGQTPQLAASSVPSVANLAFSLDVTQATPSAQLLYFVTIGPPTAPTQIFPGCFVEPDVLQIIQLINLGILPLGPVPADVAGAGSLPFPIPNDPSLVGAVLTWQIAFPDATPPGVSLSNGLLMTVQ